MAKGKWDNPDIPDKPNAIAGWCVMGAADERNRHQFGRFQSMEKVILLTFWLRMLNFTHVNWYY